MLLLTTGELKCFIGVALGSHAQEITGAIMACSGMCSNVTLAIHNTVATIFTCDPFDVCQTIEIDNECNLQLPGKRYLKNYLIKIKIRHFYVLLFK